MGLALLSGALFCPAASGEPWKLTGRVLNDDQKGAGMQGVEVAVYADKKSTDPLVPPTLSDEMGKFELVCEPAGPQVEVRYKKTGHQINLAAIVVHSAEEGRALPPARCRRADTSTGLTAFTTGEITSTLTLRQQGLSRADAEVRKNDDLGILQDLNVEPSRISEVRENLSKLE